MDRYEAVGAVEALRSGTTSRSLCSVFSYGRESLLERIRGDLDSVARDRRMMTLILKGEYGEGKTHLLNIVFNDALDRKFAVSFVVLSKETPFGRLDRVYPKVVCGTYLPGEAEPGIEPLVRDLRLNGRTTAEILTFAKGELHPKIFHVLENYLHQNDAYYRHLLFSDIAGEWLPVNQLKSMHRLNLSYPAKIPRFRPSCDVWDYFRLVSHLVRERGLSGWVILFDEFELVGSLGVGERAKAYANMGRFLFPDKEKGLDATYVVFSVAARFWSDVLVREKRADIDVVPQKLVSKGAVQEAEFIRRVLNALVTEPQQLEPLLTGELERMLRKVEKLHSEAYAWQPDIDLGGILGTVKHSRLRTKIRYMLEFLDLRYLYGEDPKVEARVPDETILYEGFNGSGVEEAEGITGQPPNEAGSDVA